MNSIDFKKIKPRRNEEHEERKKYKSLERIGFSCSLRALGALRGEILLGAALLEQEPSDVNKSNWS
jgi:hypothetical protein